MPSNTRLREYTGHQLKVQGQLMAHLKYQDQSAMSHFLLLKAQAHPFLEENGCPK